MQLEYAQVKKIIMLDTMSCFRRQRSFRWLAEEFEPLTLYSHEDGRRCPFFTEFLLAPQQSSRGRFYCGLYAGYDHARKEDWSEWVDWLFMKEQGVHALATVADLNGIQEIGVWLMLPYPPPGDYMYEQGKRPRRFNIQLHRLLALHDAIETVIERWSRFYARTPVRLRGFVWGRQGIPEADVEVVEMCNEWIASLGLERLWMANYRSNRVIEWRELHFSAIALFANYTGRSEYGKDWLYNTGKFAALNGMGIQVVNGRGVIYDPNHADLYLEMVKKYFKQGGRGPLVYTFPNTTPLDVLIEDPTAYHRIYDSVTMTIPE